MIPKASRKWRQTRESQICTLRDRGFASCFVHLLFQCMFVISSLGFSSFICFLLCSRFTVLKLIFRELYWDVVPFVVEVLVFSFAFLTGCYSFWTAGGPGCNGSGGSLLVDLVLATGSALCAEHIEDHCYNAACESLI